jgi:hypothetical protein
VKVSNIAKNSNENRYIDNEGTFHYGKVTHKGIPSKSLTDAMFEDAVAVSEIPDVVEYVIDPITKKKKKKLTRTVVNSKTFPSFTPWIREAGAGVNIVNISRTLSKLWKKEKHCRW